MQVLLTQENVAGGSATQHNRIGTARKPKRIFSSLFSYLFVLLFLLLRLILVIIVIMIILLFIIIILFSFCS